MKNSKKILGIIIVLLICSLGFNIVLAVTDVTGEPGSAQDPIVSKSYVDALIVKLQAENAALKTAVSNLESALNVIKNQGPSGLSNSFAVIEVEAGQAIITGSGTEIVLRGGTANAIKGQNGGLSDTTSAKDLENGAALTINHLLISSRDDGRGLHATSKCWVLVRGAYRTETRALVTATPAPTSAPAPTPTPRITPAPTPTPVPTQAPAVTKKYGKVNATSLNLRSQPVISAQNIISQLRTGEIVEIISMENNWAQVRTSGGLTGWVSADYLIITE